MNAFIELDRVRVREDAAKLRKELRGQVGTVVRWHHDHIYTVKLDSGMEIVAQADEMENAS